jgi:hypothetical protein
MPWSLRYMSKDFTIQELFQEALTTDTDLNRMGTEDIEKSAIEYTSMVKDLMLELIGEDDYDTLTPQVIAKNLYKRELRHKVNDL